MKVDGRCHCGRITFEAEVDPTKVLICHCTDCQILSGGAFRTVVRVPADKFRLLSGKPKVYVKQADSGNKFAQAFCGECGTPVYGTHPIDEPKFYGLRVGTLRQRNALPPKLQIWCRSEQPWLGGLDTVERVEQHA
jgi:hypothetical protein